MWAYESVFYQIYPLGFCGAPFENDGVQESRILKVIDWADHIKSLNCNAVYFSPVFESDTHGYNTRDFTKIDCRLGSNEDFAQENALATMKEYGVAPQAWGPLAEGKHGIFSHPVLSEIGAKYGKTAAQIALKWNTQRGVSILPKSVHVERMEQNIDIWDFTLSDEDMQKIAELDLGHSEIVNHDDPGFVKMLNSLKA